MAPQEPQASEPQDPWQPFHFFLGKWEGTGEGRPGVSRVERVYEWILGGKFIRLRDRATYEPQKKNPSGEVHEEIGFFSRDEARKTHVYREFHLEGFVHRYTAAWSPDGKTLTLTTEAIENIPPGWQARTTCEIINENRFRETFELAAPGREWETYISIAFRRAS